MTKPNKKYKIALIGYQLAGGGLEKVMSSLSVYFGTLGIDVHNVLFVDAVAYPYSGTLVNIGKMKENHKGLFGKLKLFFFFKRYIAEHDFDFVIDFRYRIHPLQEVLISRWVYPKNTIYTVHSGNTETYVPKNKFLSKLIFKGKYAVVCVSDAIKNALVERYGFSNAMRIYNPIHPEKIIEQAAQKNDVDFNYVVGMGRFDYKNVKQFDKLIATYLKSDLIENNIHLILIGDGERRNEMERIANSHPMIHFVGFQTNPYPYLKNALFSIVSSKYEGFPLTIIESLACGTPVVSFDCVSGPNEMICHQINGLLVENQNFEALTQAINLLGTDKALYEICKNNAAQSIHGFAIEKIGEEWLRLMKIEVYS